MPSTRRSSARRRRLATAAFVVVLGALQLRAMQSSAMVEVDPEESVNAGQALALRAGHVGDLLRLQYVDFCGGCTVDAVAGAGLFSVLPPSWLAWKLIPIAWLLLFAAVAVTRLARWQGQATAVAAGLLLLLPVETWLRLSLLGLGNHVECALLIGMALLTLGPRPGPVRALVVGAWLGLSVWVGYSAAFGLPAALAWLVLRRRFRCAAALSLGGALGLLALVGRTVLTQHFAVRTLYPTGWFEPDAGRVGARLLDLLRPPELASALGSSLDASGLLWVLVLGAFAAALAVTIRRRPPLGGLLLLALASWLVAYSLVGFSLEQATWQTPATPVGLRYLAPVYLLGLLLLAIAAGTLWDEGRRRAAALLLAPALLAGGLARLASLRDAVPLSTLGALSAVDPDLWHDVFSERLTEAELASCGSRDPAHRALRAWALGRRAAESGALPPADLPLIAWAGGLGMGAQRSAAAARGEETERGLLDRLDVLGLSAEARRAALRSYWSSEVLDHGLPNMPPADPDSALALAWVQGRDAGRVAAAWFQPRPEALEALLPARPTDDDLAGAWLVGLGHGAAERWGPATVPLTLAGLSEPELGLLRTGYAEGVSARWLPTPGR